MQRSPGPPKQGTYNHDDDDRHWYRHSHSDCHHSVGGLGLRQHSASCNQHPHPHMAHGTWHMHTALVSTDGSPTRAPLRLGNGTDTGEANAQPQPSPGLTWALEPDVACPTACRRHQAGLTSEPPSWTRSRASLRRQAGDTTIRARGTQTALTHAPAAVLAHTALHRGCGGGSRGTRMSRAARSVTLRRGEACRAAVGTRWAG